MKDLAPQIYRQRLVVEGVPDAPISAEAIEDYLRGLGPVLDMKVLTTPVTHRSDKFGWSGWVHWETSGTHFYAWERPLLFFSADIYTCKKFEVDRAVEYTTSYFKAADIAFGSF